MSIPKMIPLNMRARISTLKITLFVCLAFQSHRAFADKALTTSLLERQKELYSQSQWDAFFGGAIYIRASGTPDITDHALALELMALARHCQWAAIQDLTNGAQEMPHSPLSNKALDLIRLKKDFQAFLSDPKNARESMVRRWSRERDQWPISRRELKLVSDPKNLRLHVRSLCE